MDAPARREALSEGQATGGRQRRATKRGYARDQGHRREFGDF
jgi:hypothetical protein